MAQIADVLDKQSTVTKGEKSGEGQLPAALLTRLRDLGIDRTYTVQVQEVAGAVFVQFCFYDKPAAA